MNSKKVELSIKETLLLATFSETGGPGEVVRALGPELQKIGFSVDVRTRIRQSLYESALTEPRLALGAAIDNFVIRDARFQSPISLLRQASRRLLADEFDYDFAILGWLPGLLQSADFEKLKDTATAIRIPDEHVYTGTCHYASACSGFTADCSNCPAVKKPARKKVELSLEKKMSNYSYVRRKIFVAPSEWIASRARESRALSNEKITIIRNPISTTFFNSDEATSKAKVFTILFVASQVFDPVKGFGQIAADLEKLAIERGADVRVVGYPGREASKYPKFTFLGRLETRELAAEFSKAWVTIVPSLNETSGNVVAESLASGTTVLARDVDGLGEVVGRVDEKYVFQTNEDLFEKLRKFDLESELSKAPEMRKVARLHEPAVVAKQYADVLKTL